MLSIAEMMIALIVLMAIVFALATIGKVVLKTLGKSPVPPVTGWCSTCKAFVPMKPARNPGEYYCPTHKLIAKAKGHDKCFYCDNVGSMGEYCGNCGKHRLGQSEYYEI